MSRSSMRRSRPCARLTSITCVCSFTGLVLIGIEPAAVYDSGLRSAANLQVRNMDTGGVSLDRGRGAIFLIIFFSLIL
jgi:hypothetical protein